MITVLTRPDPLMLSGNPIDVEVLATRPDGSPIVSAGGSRATLTGQPGQGLGTGVFLSLNWTNPEGRSLSVNFHTDGPFPAAYEIPEYQGGDLSAYWDQLASVIGSNQEVAPFFLLSSSRNLDNSYTITATARSNDPTWSVAWGPNSSSDFSVVNDIAGSNDGSYRVRIEVFMDRGEGFEEIGSFGTSPNENSRVSFDIGQVIDKAIEEVLPLPGIPDFDTSAPFLGTNIYPYYIRIADFSTDTGYGEAQVIADRKAFAGKVGGALLAVGNFLERVSSGNSWLCSRPDRRTIGRNEPVFLSWLSPNEGVISPDLRIQEVDSSGETTSRLMFSGAVTTTDRSPIVYPVGAAALGIDEDTVYYRVRVESAGVELSPWRMFVLDFRRHEEERYLAYLNSFYLPEIFRCTGDMESSLDVSRQQYSRVRPLNGGMTIPGKGTWRVDTAEEYNYYSGYKPRLELVAVLRELVASPYVYQITAGTRTALLPIARGFDLGNPKDNLFAAVLPFELAELEQGAAFGSPAGPGIPPPNDGEDGGDLVPDTGEQPGETGNSSNWRNALEEWTNAGEIWYND